MAKENLILLAILLSTLIFPGLATAGKTIQTTQQLIVIDPGHGGAINGLVSSGGLEEKTIVLALAKKTANRLENRYNILLTRTRDMDISSRERIFMANKNHADLFLSIHLHRSKQPAAFLFYFDPTGTDEKNAQAAVQTWKTASLRHQAQSKQAADSFADTFFLKKKNLKLFIKGAPVVPLEGSTMTALLIEPLSISLLPRHPDEMDALLDEYAQLISESIDQYLRKKP